jgi:RNA polymerase sigma-70 factor, ECF subfamily
MLHSRSKGQEGVTPPISRSRGVSASVTSGTVDPPTTPGLTDERAIVDRAKGGDPSAQGDLFDFYWPKVVRYTFAHCGNQHDAEDLAADVFLRMVEAIARFQWRDEIPFTAWLFRIAHNQVISHYRRSGRVTSLIEDGVGDPTGDEDPEEEVELRLALDEVYRAAAQLPRSQQEVIRLRFAADLSLADTARILEKKENNIKQLQHKAISRMRQLLDNEAG